MKKHNCIKVLPFLLPLLLLTACEKDRLLNRVGVDFTATMEQPSNSDSKVRLVNEQWIYWEQGDSISVGSNTTTDNTAVPESGFLTGVSPNTEDFDQFNGIFHTTLPEGSIYFLGLYPHSKYNRIAGSGSDSDNKFPTAKIYLNPIQPYRDDSTFAKKVLPMVAWYGGDWEHSVPNLSFHNLAGLLRLQFFNATGTNGYKITSITVTENNTQALCGMFQVNHRYSYNPHLYPLSENPNGDIRNQLTLAMPDGGLTFDNNDLKSFYLVLPARHGMDTATNYSLTVTVNATKTGSDSYTFTKSMSNVGTRRNGITYTRAVGVTEFKPSNSSTTVGLVGNGDSIRPFKIYTPGDMQYLRNCFNEAAGNPVYVNGQEVTRNTHFRIMRSDIELNTSNWSTGIKEFKGKMTYYSNAAVAVHGITNHSQVPIFQSISADGKVEGLTVRCDGTSYATGDYSPFCGTNRGKIIDCHVTTPSGKTVVYNCTNFAGICLSNRGDGLIEGSSCSLVGTFGCVTFAGICLNNEEFRDGGPSLIRGCIAASPMSIVGVTGSAAGICHTNHTRVEDCYTDMHYTTGSTDWGGIVYQNESGGTVKHCYVSQSAIIHSDVVGGIVCNNANGGTVDYCWSHGELRGTHVGGIVSTVSGGEVRNCFVDDNLCIFTLLASASPHCAGGLVAELTGGAIKNSFVNMHHIATLDFTGIEGAVVGKMTGGSIVNCYSREEGDMTPDFYGSKTGGTITYSWLVTTGETQEGVSKCANIATDENGNGKSDLQDALDAHRPAGDNYRTWDTGPKLSPYTLNGGRGI